jgi:protein SCO1/2
VLTASAIDRAARAAAGRRWAWGVLVAALAAWPFIHALRTRVPPEPPVLGTAPPFRLVDQDARPFASGALAGRVWLASFFSTRCEDGCEAATRGLARVQGRARNLEPALHLVSISVDPAHDAPARLATYARAQRASPRMWTFLTGTEESVGALERALRARVAHGLPASESPPGADLVLVDGASRIRGYYDARDPAAVDRAVRDAALLVNGGGRRQ